MAPRATAHAILHALENFLHHAESPSWTDESDWQGVSSDLSYALDEHGGFRELSHRWDGSALVFEVEPLEMPETLAHFMREFFRMFGYMATDTQFIGQRLAPGEIIIDVALGFEDGEPHGCLVQIHLVGDKIVQFLGEQRRWVEEQERKTRGR